MKQQRRETPGRANAKDVYYEDGDESPAPPPTNNITARRDAPPAPADVQQQQQQRQQQPPADVYREESDGDTCTCHEFSDGKVQRAPSPSNDMKAGDRKPRRGIPPTSPSSGADEGGDVSEVTSQTSISDLPLNSRQIYVEDEDDEDE